MPMTVARHRRGCDLNPGHTAAESSTLTTRLPTCTDYFSLIVRQNMSAVSTASGCIVRTVDASVILMLASEVVVDCEWRFRQMWSQWLLTSLCYPSSILLFSLLRVSASENRKYISTDHFAAKVMRSVVTVRFFLLLYLLNQLTLNLMFFFRLWIITVAHRGLKVKVICEGQGWGLGLKR